MRVSMRILRRIVTVIVLLMLALLFFLWLKPPALLRVGAGYAAKILSA